VDDVFLGHDSLVLELITIPKMPLYCAEHGERTVSAMALQNLRRLDGEIIAIEDADVVIVCAGDTSMANLALIGCGVRTGTSGWRCLRQVMIDIGYRPTRELAVVCLLEDWKRHRQATPIWRGFFSSGNCCRFPSPPLSKSIGRPVSN
jgi:hypothetical protein